MRVIFSGLVLFHCLQETALKLSVPDILLDTTSPPALLPLWCYSKALISPSPPSCDALNARAEGITTNSPTLISKCYFKRRVFVLWNTRVLQQRIPTFAKSDWQQQRIMKSAFITGFIIKSIISILRKTEGVKIWGCRQSWRSAFLGVSGITKKHGANHFRNFYFFNS